MLDHTALVNRERENRESLGYTLQVENQNSFRLRGRYATLAGKPDLIAVKNSNAVIIDAKTGRASPHHAIQVMTYQYPVPKALEQYRGMEFRGRVAYTESNVEIPTSRIDTTFVHNLGSVDTTAGSRQTGPAECRVTTNAGFATSPVRDCPQRGGRTARHRHGHHRRLLGRRTPCSWALALTGRKCQPAFPASATSNINRLRRPTTTK